MVDALNPVEVEQAIRDSLDTITASVRAVTEALITFRAADRRFDVAYASAFMLGGGSVQARKYQADLATEKQREERDVAEAAWRYAERRANAAELTLSAYQTLAKSVMAMYGAAGHGEY